MKIIFSPLIGNINNQENSKKIKNNQTNIYNQNLTKKIYNYKTSQNYPSLQYFTGTNKEKNVQIAQKIAKYFQSNDVAIQENDVLNILDKLGLDNNAVEFLISSKSTRKIGQAYVISKLIDENYIDYETLNAIAKKENNVENFKAIYVDNECKNYFSQIIDACNFDNDHSKALKQIAQGINQGAVDTKDANKTFEKFNSLKGKELQEAIYGSSLNGYIDFYLKKYNQIFSANKTVQKEKEDDVLWQISNNDIEDNFKFLKKEIKNLEKAERLMKNDMISKLYQEKALDEFSINEICKLHDETIKKVISYLEDEELFEMMSLNDMIAFAVNTGGNDDVFEREIIEKMKNKEVTCFENAREIISNPLVRIHYAGHLLNKTEPKIASLLACCWVSSDFPKVEEIKELLKTIGIDENAKGIFTNEFVEYLSSHQDIDIQDMNNWAKEYVNFKEIEKIAPNFATFGPMERLTFITHHYLNNTKEFNKESLTFNQDLTKFLSNHPTSNKVLTDLFSIFPATTRNVGEIPNTWLDEVKASKKEQAQEEIYQIISNFQKTRNVELFEKELSKVLNKKAKIEELASGISGFGYKITLDDKSFCLKLFKPSKFELFTQQNDGQHIEVQMGLFANKHSNDFVKMYFGRVAPLNNSDGFLVSQFLSDDVEPEIDPNADLDSYVLYSQDATDKSNGHNKINGKIIDFGRIGIQKN